MNAHFSDVHSDLQGDLKKIPQFTFASWNLWLIRMLTNLQPKPKMPEDLIIENRFILSSKSNHRIRLRVYRPKLAPTKIPVLLWIHGGGYIIGKPEMDDSRCIQFVRETGIVVVSVDYRLAPKHPFPIPLEDSYDALKWVHAHASELGVDPARIAIGGASAGGGLAASLVQLAVDRQEVKPIFQLLVYPMLDDKTVDRTDVADKVYFNWNVNSNRFGWESYLAAKAGTTNLPAYAVPSRRMTLASLPPAWIGVGTLDLFYDEDAAYAQRLKHDGVKCDLFVVEGAFHGFDVFGASQVVRVFQNAQIEALRRYLLPATELA
ncbi:MAG: alpha/beta hydrolase [Chloroflexi bacterium]|nr:alpha/beta hydrolase [Chloroflexota bacterium]MCC6893710.1 alpha/beta hydrolase [Anaerolineae bacterium]